MALELRPTWCLEDRDVESVIDLGEWVSNSGRPVLAWDGDDWKPGDAIAISRMVELNADVNELRRQLKLSAGQRLGLTARWVCRSTGLAGTHEGGPTPLDLLEDTRLSVAIPSSLAHSVELETCLVASWVTSERPPGTVPDGGLVWSDGWSLPRRTRTVQLEGDELRLPVRTVSFREHFGEVSGALWAIDLDPSVTLEDLVTNVVTVLLNRDVLVREFKDESGEPDAAAIPPSAVSGIQVDLVRCLTAALMEDDDLMTWDELPEGSVGAMLARRLTEAFGGVRIGRDLYTDDQPAFARGLWRGFAPERWERTR